MDYPKFITSSKKEESIRIQRVKHKQANQEMLNSVIFFLFLKFLIYSKNLSLEFHVTHL